MSSTLKDTTHSDVFLYDVTALKNLCKIRHELLCIAVKKVGLQSYRPRARNIFLAVVDKEGVLGRDAVGGKQMLEDLSIRLYHMKIARENQTVKV